jgi:uncharacterized SAM-binding protein YcdF (DUF218 family)
MISADGDLPKFSSSRRLKQRGIAAASLAAVILCFLAFTRLGHWIVLQDPLEKADSIVVFGGDLPYRAMEAADLYRAGWAPEVWITQGESEQTRETARILPDFLPEHENSRKVLEALGVPRTAIRTIEPPVVATLDEVKAVADNLRARKLKHAILVTSSYHTRRVKVTWKAVAGDHVEAIVRYSRRTPFDPDRWWRNSRDVLAVSREVGGILNAWAGFPLNASRN